MLEHLILSQRYLKLFTYFTITFYSWSSDCFFFLSLFLTVLSSGSQICSVTFNLLLIPSTVFFFLNFDYTLQHWFILLYFLKFCLSCHCSSTLLPVLRAFYDHYCKLFIRITTYLHFIISFEGFIFLFVYLFKMYFYISLFCLTFFVSIN